jgi:hypothetical protein
MSTALPCSRLYSHDDQCAFWRRKECNWTFLVLTKPISIYFLSEFRVHNVSIRDGPPMSFRQQSSCPKLMTMLRRCQAGLPHYWDTPQTIECNLAVVLMACFLASQSWSLWTTTSPAARSTTGSKLSMLLCKGASSISLKASRRTPKFSWEIAGTVYYNIPSDRWWTCKLDTHAVTWLTG